MKLRTALLAILCLTPLASLRGEVRPTRPTDDQAWGDTGYNGLKKIPTPALDALAPEGVSLFLSRGFFAAPSVSFAVRNVF